MMNRKMKLLVIALSLAAIIVMGIVEYSVVASIFAPLLKLVSSNPFMPGSASRTPPGTAPGPANEIILVINGRKATLDSTNPSATFPSAGVGTMTLGNDSLNYGSSIYGYCGSQDPICFSCEGTENTTFNATLTFAGTDYAGKPLNSTLVFTYTYPYMNNITLTPGEALPQPQVYGTNITGFITLILSPKTAEGGFAGTLTVSFVSTTETYNATIDVTGSAGTAPPGTEPPGTAPGPAHEIILVINGQEATLNSTNPSATFPPARSYNLRTMTLGTYSSIYGYYSQDKIDFSCAGTENTTYNAIIGFTGTDSAGKSLDWTLVFSCTCNVTITPPSGTIPEGPGANVTGFITLILSPKTTEGTFTGTLTVSFVSSTETYNATIDICGTD